VDCDGSVGQALGNVGSHGVMKEIKSHAWEARLSVMQVNRGQMVHYGNPTPPVGSKWLLCPMQGKIWRDVTRYDVWASTICE